LRKALARSYHSVEADNTKGNAVNMIRAQLLALLLVVFTVASANSAMAQIVALGASNTQGRGVSPQEAWPEVLEGMLRARGSNVHVANAGISGDTTGGELARLDSAVPDGTRIVILNFGRNDFKRGKHGGGMISPDMRQANMAKIRSELHRRGIRTIEADGMIDSIRSAGMVQADGIHLTAEGHRRVAARLAGMVR
jgi:acyl-CoA thioesterase I